MNAPVATRLAELFDADSATGLAAVGAAGSVIARRGTIGGQHAILAAIDPRVARGAIGTAEAGVLGTIFERAAARREPLVLVLDSAGARLDEGLAALGAFRRLYAVALAAKRDGVPLLAVIGTACFGGASMLACLAERRIYSARSRLGMSGPRIIDALSGRAELDARDPDAIGAVFGGIARARLHACDRVVGDDTQDLRAAIAEWLATREAARLPSFDVRHRVLRERIEKSGVQLPRSPRPAGALLRQRMAALLPEGFETLIGAGVVRGVRMAAGREVTITGIVDGARLDAVAAWMIAESVVTSVRTRPERPIVMLYDSVGHAMTRADEALLLSEYLAHLAESILWARGHGVAVSTWIIGEASGGAYVALTAHAHRVLALPGTHMRVLPDAAVAQVLAAPGQGDPGDAAWGRYGLVDDTLRADALPAAVARAAGLPMA